MNIFKFYFNFLVSFASPPTPGGFDGGNISTLVPSLSTSFWNFNFCEDLFKSFSLSHPNHSSYENLPKFNPSFPENFEFIKSSNISSFLSAMPLNSGKPLSVEEMSALIYNLVLCIQFLSSKVVVNDYFLDDRVCSVLKRLNKLTKSEFESLQR